MKTSQVLLLIAITTGRFGSPLWAQESAVFIDQLKGDNTFHESSSTNREAATNPETKILKETGGNEIDSRASSKLPEGWTVEKTAQANDFGLRASRSSNVIRMRLFGGKGSRYGTAEAYLGGIEAGTMGRPPETNEVVTVSGINTRLYRHGYPINLGDPHAVDPRPPQLATEQFCMVPAGDRFFVLSYAHESLLPELSGEGDKAWRAFLRSFKLLNNTGDSNTNKVSLPKRP